MEKLTSSEIIDAVDKMNLTSSIKMKHPSSLMTYIMTYHYEMEIINIPSCNMSSDQIFSCFNFSLKDVLNDDSEIEGNHIRITENMDIETRVELIRNHINSLTPSTYNRKKIEKNGKEVHVSGLITHGGMHEDNTSKMLLRMKKNASGRIYAKWGAGYKEDKQVRLIRATCISDLVDISEEEFEALSLAGYPEFDLFGHIVRQTSGEKDVSSKSETGLRKKRKNPFLNW